MAYYKVIETETYTYEGITNAKGEPNGNGVMRFISGGVYEGTFKGGKLHGWGKKIFNDGEIDEGIFKKGTLVRGKITYYSGVVVEGTFKDGTKLVKGKRIRPNGMIEEGVFDGSIYGGLAKGKIIYSNGVIYEGKFNAATLEGKGKIVWFDGTVVKGTFDYGHLTGEVKITLNRRIYKTTCENGWIALKGVCVNGYGKRISESGNELEEGEFERGNLVKGKKTYANGTVEEVK